MAYKDARYNQDFDEVSEAVRDMAGWQCEHCGAENGPGRVLTTHHLDRNKLNDRYWNLVAFCQVCHLHFERKLSILQFSFVWSELDWLTFRQRMEIEEG